MSNQQVIYSELNLSRDPEKQRRRPEGTKSSTAENIQEITYAEFSFQNPCQKHQEIDKDHNSRESLPPPEKLLAGLLGTTCLALMATVIVMVIAVSPPTTIQHQNKSSLVGTPKETHNLSSTHHCARCPNEWLTFSNSCYYLGVERKTWTESVVSCTSKNSSLTYVDDEKEMKFLRSLSRLSWIGVSRSSRDHPWLLVNGSGFHRQIQESSPGEFNCVWLTTTHLIAENCESAHTYNCKRKFGN